MDRRNFLRGLGALLTTSALVRPPPIVTEIVTSTVTSDVTSADFARPLSMWMNADDCAANNSERRLQILHALFGADAIHADAALNGTTRPPFRSVSQ